MFYRFLNTPLQCRKTNLISVLNVFWLNTSVLVLSLITICLLNCYFIFDCEHVFTSCQIYLIPHFVHFHLLTTVESYQTMLMSTCTRQFYLLILWQYYEDIGYNIPRKNINISSYLLASLFRYKIQKLTYNLGNNILEIFNILENFPFITRNLILDIWHSKYIIGVALRDAEQLKERLRKIK